MNRQQFPIAVMMGLVVVGLSIPAWATSHDVGWTFGNVGSASYRLNAFEPASAGLGASLGAQDPTLILQIGKRYQVTVTNYLAHPFEVLAKGASAVTDTVLLAMGGATGSFESNPAVAWADNGLGTVSFLLTADLHAAMLTPGHVPGYRCGVHVFSMRGNFNVLPPDDPTPGPGPGPAPDPVGNDNCFNATPISDVQNLPFDTRQATFDGPGLCMTSPNIWYCYTAPCNGEVTVSLLGSSYDTVLGVFDGCACYPRAGDVIACNDDFGGSQSQATFTATAGSQYLIEIGGFGSASGLGLLSITCEGAAGAENPDLGDAPDSSNNLGRTMAAYPLFTSITARYPTVFDDGRSVGPYGPVHVNAQTVAYLGRTITSEREADVGLDEDGANNIQPLVNRADRDNGDDAVTLPLHLPDCGWATIDYMVTVVTPGRDLWVNVWLDFNRDGDWDDTVACPGAAVPEWAIQNQCLFDLPGGLHRITSPGFLSAHRAHGPQEIWMRMTLADQPWKGGSNPGAPGNGGSGPRLKYQLGETEDYLFVPDTTNGSQPAQCADLNGDGVVDISDLLVLIDGWLQTCQ